MTIKLQKPDITELKPRITVFGVGGGGGNAVNNMISAGLQGVDFVVANTDAQALTMTRAERIIQMGVAVTEGLGAGSQPEIGSEAARECIDEINDHVNGTHMCFVTAGMGGGTGTGAAPIVAEAARAKGILTVGVVTKPFHFEGQRRMRIAEEGIVQLQEAVDTLIVIPNQNLFRIANDKTTFADAFAMADQVLYSGVACITDLMVKEGLINLDFADVRSVMREMGKAMMGTGEASGGGRAMAAAEAAISNPLLDETSMKGAQGLLISITGGRDMTLFEVDEAATRIREEVDSDANIILGATFDEDLEGLIRVSVVATGIDRESVQESTNVNAAAQIHRPVQQTVAPGTTLPTAESATAAVRSIEAELARELDKAMSQRSAESLASAASADDFKPRSKLFSGQEAPRPAIQSRATSQPATPPVAGPSAASPVAPTMPRVEDFPPFVHAEARHNRGRSPTVALPPAPALTVEPVSAGTRVRTEVGTRAQPERSPTNQKDREDRGPMGLLKRLSNSLVRCDEETVATAGTPPTMPAPAVGWPLSAEASAYAPRDNAGSGQNGSPRPVKEPSEDDHLEIPAFLRRQAM